MLVFSLLLLGFLALSEGQGYNNQYGGGYSQQNNQQAAPGEYPPEPLGGNMYQNPKQFYGQQYGEQPNGRKPYGPAPPFKPQQRQQQKYYNNGPQQNQRHFNNQQRFGQNNYNNNNNQFQRNSGKAFPGYNQGQNNQNQYQRQNPQVKPNGYNRPNQASGGLNYRGKQINYGNNNPRGYTNNGNQNQGYRQNGPAKGYNNVNGNQYQNNGFNGGNGYNNMPQPQGRALPPAGGNGYSPKQQQPPNRNFEKREPSFYGGGQELTSADNLFDAFRQHNAGTRDNFASFNALQVQSNHGYGSAGENKPASLEAMERLAQTLPYDLDNVDGMGIF